MPRGRRGVRAVLVLALGLAGARRADAGEAAPATPVEICDPATPAAVNDHFVQPAATREMVAAVRKIYDEADPLRNPFRSSEQLPLLEARIAQTRDPQEMLELKLQRAIHLLQAGRIDESLVQHDELLDYARSHNLPVDDRLENIVLTGKAMCYLRSGETANCLLGHNADSCLFPIRGGGVHKLQEGSRLAVAELTKLLEKFPGDLRGRWLLNIAYMTLGEYPGKVPARWLIPPQSFASEADLGRFPDIAANVGLDVDGWAGGVVTEDFDHDGFLDVMVSSWGFRPGDQLRVFRNNGDGTFTERTKEAGLNGIVSGLNMIHGDYDNDGFADVLVLRGGWLRTEGHYPFSLLRNNGDFTFTDVTAEAGLAHFRPSQTAVWWDYNGDGWLDIFVANESTGRDEAPCELFRNNGNGTFTECAAQNGLDLIGFYKGVVSGDYNNDGHPDLFLSNRSGAKVLLRNDGPAGPDHSPAAQWKFTDVTEAAGIDGPTNSFPCWFWDYDNDGWMDIMITGYAIQDSGDVAAEYLGRPHAGQKSKLYHNNGDGTFTDVSRACGVNKLLPAMGANFGDLDNDGWLDFYVGTGDPDFTTIIPSRMFRNDGGKRFQDVTTSGGFGQLQKGHGIAFADLNNDGTQDIYSKVGGAAQTDNYHSQLFFNPGQGNHWLKLELQGVQTNRVAIGARIKVVLREHGAQRLLRRVVGTGASFGSSPLRQEIGVGQSDVIERVEVFWPVPGVMQVFTGLEVDHAYRIVQGQTSVVPVALKSFAYAKTPRAPHQHQLAHAP